MLARLQSSWAIVVDCSGAGAQVTASAGRAQAGAGLLYSAWKVSSNRSISEILSSTFTPGSRIGKDATRAMSGMRSILTRLSRTTSAAVTLDALLEQPAQAPVALHGALELRIGFGGELEVAHDRQQLLGAGAVRRRLAAMPGDELALVYQVHVATQRRAGPDVLGHAQPLVRRRAPWTCAPCRRSGRGRCRRFQHPTARGPIRN